MKPFDCCVIVASILDLAKLQSDQDILLAIVMANFYRKFFGGRTYDTRGDA